MTRKISEPMTAPHPAVENSRVTEVKSLFTSPYLACMYALSPLAHTYKGSPIPERPHPGSPIPKRPYKGSPIPKQPRCFWNTCLQKKQKKTTPLFIEYVPEFCRGSACQTAKRRWWRTSPAVCLHAPCVRALRLCVCARARARAPARGRVHARTYVCVHAHD